MVGKNDLISRQTDPNETGLQGILQTVKKVQQRLQDENDTADQLNLILHDKSMQALLRVHERIHPIEKRLSLEPVSHNAESLLGDVQSSVAVLNLTQETDELSQIVFSPHLRALLQCHDQIANKEFEPELPDADISDSALNDEEESMKVVRLVKGNEPLGATIAVDELTENIVIARILKGGAADRSGLIHVNDILVEVNKVPAQGKKPEELIKLLADFRGPLTFRLIPGESSIYHQEEKTPQMFVRANFNYDPKYDRLIPCAEAGLKFKKNDVLQIVSRDDESWWQASVVKEGVHARSLGNRERNDDSFERGQGSKGSTRAGLIPSVKLQTRRDALRRQATINCNNNTVKGSSTSLTSKDRTEKKGALASLRQSFRRSKKRLDGPNLMEEKAESTVSLVPPVFNAYEEVMLMSPAASVVKEDRLHRPLVLVGPQGVGRNELKDSLIDSNPTHYGVPVPHTSRPKLPEEENGRDYHFVNRDFMEKGIRDGMFLEYGEYKGNLYGTSLSAVKEVTNTQQVCVLTPYPQALKVLRSGDLKPFVIFIKPPSLLQMGNKSGNSAARGRSASESLIPFSSEELEDLIIRGEKMENNFGHLFDYVIVNDGIDRAFSELKQVAFSVENEPQWVLKDWMQAI